MERVGDAFRVTALIGSRAKVVKTRPLVSEVSVLSCPSWGGTAELPWPVMFRVSAGPSGASVGDFSLHWGAVKMSLQVYVA